MSSFQKRRSTPLIAGAKHSLHSGQQIVSTGNASLDYILGGGLPIGSILLIEEDKIGRYAKCLMRLFLAEGSVYKHAMFIANLDADPSDTIKKLPRMIVETNPPKSTKPIDGLNAAQSTDEMRIAWRYNNLEKVDSVQGSTNQVDGQNAYTFDLSQCVDGVDIPNFDLTTFDGSHDEQSTADATSIFHHPPFHALLDRLKLKIREETFDVASTTSQNKNLLRIGIESLGSPLWWSDHFVQDLCQFLTILKAAVRHSHAVCCITMPTYLFKYTDSALLHRVRNIVDFALELESFAGTEREANPLFKEYHGLFHIRKLAALNALAVYTPETHDLAFKLRRKRLVIEKLHLPPELQDSEAREEDESILSAMSCGSSSKHRLEF